jgi:hypothetical protein
MRSPHVVVRARAAIKATHRIQLRGFSVRRPVPPVKGGSFPLSGFGSLSGFHPLATAIPAPSSQAGLSLAPSKVCSPPTFFQLRRATYTRRFPGRRLRCALRVSHPLDALLPPKPTEPIPSRSRSWGFPSRFLSSDGVVRAHRAPCPSGVVRWRPQAPPDPLQGLNTPPKAQTVEPGY